MRKAIWNFKKHHSFWLDWFGSFGREIGCSKPWFTDNPNVFISTVEHTISTRHHCVLSVQPFRASGVVYGLEKVFFDFVSKTKHCILKETFKEVRGFTKWLKEHFDVEPLIVRTWRGFHVYVFLRNVEELDFGQEKTCKSIYSLLQNEMLKEVPHYTLNRNCLGDLKQLARVPYSIYENGVNCVPIDFDGRPMQIHDLDVYRERGITQGLFANTTHPQLRTTNYIRQLLENKCPHHYLGYLSERSKGEEIPEECMACKKTIECMLFKLNKSDRAIKEIRKWYK